ncbi:hypothetical protein ACT3TZ_06460 [Brachybacterium sp. AOP25-B2-12]|uniref:hypothetical protein n=1 Tax=Brachybacterium sp. AOP25-B2-12 TaxID=3457710 RepID=UPI004034668F
MTSSLHEPTPENPTTVTPRHGDDATARPALRDLFARQLARLDLTADGEAVPGAMPDLEIAPSEVTPEIARELEGLTIAIPSVETWGVFGGLRSTGTGAWAVVIGDSTFDIPDSARLHVSSKAWREAGEGEVEVPAPIEAEVDAEEERQAEDAQRDD